MRKRNAFYAQSGGVTAVINASACGVIETARRHRDVIGKVYAGRNGIIGALREELIDTSQGIGARDCGTAQYSCGRVRFVSAQAEIVRRRSARIPTPDRGIQGARHRLLLLQRRRRFAGHRQQSGAVQCAARLSDHVHRRAEDRRQRSAVHRHLPRIRLRREVCRGVDPRSGARRREHVRNLDESVRDGSDGPPRGLDCGRRGPGADRRRAVRRISIVFPEIAFDRAGFLQKVDETVKRDGYCVDRGVRGRAPRGRQFPCGSRHARTPSGMPNSAVSRRRSLN